MNRKIPPKPTLASQSQEPSEDQISAFIRKAPDAQAMPASAPAPEMPAKLRRAKAQFTLTLDPGIVEEVDVMAPYVGLSRSSIVNMLLRRWLDEEKAKRSK